jgi:hypothetical protein
MRQTKTAPAKAGGARHWTLHAGFGRRVDAQLGALTEGLREAFARADAFSREDDPIGRYRSAEILAALRLARSSARLLVAFARLSPFRTAVAVIHIAAAGVRAKRHVAVAAPWHPALRQRMAPRGTPPPDSDVRIPPGAPRRRGGQPGNCNRLVHGGRSRAARRNRDDVRSLLQKTDDLMRRIELAALARYALTRRNQAAPENPTPIARRIRTDHGPLVAQRVAHADEVWRPPDGAKSVALLEADRWRTIGVDRQRGLFRDRGRIVGRRYGSPPKRAFQASSCSSVILANRRSAVPIVWPGSSWSRNSAMGSDGQGMISGAGWIA